MRSMLNVAPGKPTPTVARGVVVCAAYANGRRTADLPLDQIGTVLREGDSFVWIGLYEPDDAILQTAQREFGLHELAIEDAEQAHQRPKVEQYDGSLFVVVRTAQLGRDEAGRPELSFGETHIFVGEGYLLSVRHGTERSHAELRTRCEANPTLLARGPGFVLYALIDFLV